MKKTILAVVISTIVIPAIALCWGRIQAIWAAPLEEVRIYGRNRMRFFSVGSVLNGNRASAQMETRAGGVASGRHSHAAPVQRQGAMSTTDNPETWAGWF